MIHDHIASASINRQPIKINKDQKMTFILVQYESHFLCANLLRSEQG